MPPPSLAEVNIADLQRLQYLQAEYLSRGTSEAQPWPKDVVERIQERIMEMQDRLLK